MTSVQSLVNPLTEYNQLISRTDVESINRIVEELDEQKQGSLMQWIGNNSQEQLIEQINQTITKSVELTLCGELNYSDIQYKDEHSEKRHWSEFFVIAARNYEKVFELARKYMTSVEQYELMLMTCAEFHNGVQHASAAVVATRCLHLLDEVGNAGTHIGLLNKELHRTLLNFFNGNFSELLTFIPPLTKQFRTMLENIKLGRPQQVDFICTLYVLSSIELFSKFMVDGDFSLISKAQAMLEKGRKAALQTHRTDFVYFINKLNISMHTLSVLSIWNVITYFQKSKSRREIILQYIRNKIAGKTYALYPSQLQALQNGILDSRKKNVVISMPTGSGKTLIAELILFACYLENKESQKISIYMLPSRALVYEKFDDLSRPLSSLGIQLCKLTGEVLLEPAEFISDYDIVITTPEKFDMIMRRRFYDMKVGALIVDEFHNIRSGYRGIRIQFDILRFRHQNPHEKTILISAIVSNSKAIETWIGDALSVVTYWRPTFARVGILRIRNFSAHIEFNDGVTRQIPLRQKFKGYKEVAANVAFSFISEGSCMLFSPNKDDTDVYADMILELMREFGRKTTDSLEKRVLMKRLTRIISADEKIAKLFDAGIGIHRGDLPHEVRKIIEEAVRIGLIKIIIATTTLAEGVNLPIKTIVVPRAVVGTEDMSISLFFNLLGRAGRPYHEVEGQLVFLEPTRVSQPDVSRFLKSSIKDIEPIQTSIRSILTEEKELQMLSPIKLSPKEVEKYERKKERLEIVWSVLYSQLVAGLEEGLIKKITAPDFINELVINTDETDLQTIVGDLLRRAEKHLIDMDILKEDGISQYGEMVVYPCGFSPASCKVIEIELKKRIHDIIKLKNLDTHDDFTRRVISEILAIMALPIETKMFLTQLPDKFDEKLIDWMEGASIQYLSGKYFKGEKSKCLTEIQGILASYSAWFLYAVSLVASHMTSEVEQKSSLNQLSKYLWFGTNNWMVIDVLRRDVSRELARDDVITIVKKLGIQNMKIILAEPNKLLSEPFRSQVLQSVKHDDPQDFLRKLHLVLSKPGRLKTSS